MRGRDRDADHARRRDGRFVYYRFRKPSYTGEERQSMIDRIGQHLADGRDVFAYFKHEETPEGALYAVDLLREVKAWRSLRLTISQAILSSRILLHHFAPRPITGILYSP